MIANAGAMGLDWRFLSISGYLEALDASNDMHSPDSATEPGDTSRLAAFMAAHRDG